MNNNNDRLGAPFVFILIYIFLEYGRPYSIVPIGPLRPAMWVSLFLLFSYLKCPEKKIKDPILMGIIVFILLMAKSIPFAYNNFWAYKMTESMVIYMFSILLPMMIFINNYRRLRSYIFIWICIHIFTAIMAIKNGGRGIGGILSDENDFALAINIALPYAYFMFFEASNMKKKFLFGTAMMIYLVSILCTFSRGGFLGLLAVLLFSFFYTPNKLRNFIVLAVLGVILISFIPAGYIDEMKTITNQEEIEQNSQKGRLYLWKISMRIFLDNPIMGVGANGYKYIVGNYEDRSETDRRHSGKVAHSVYFTLLPELGIPGALVYLYLIFQVFRNFYFIRTLDKDKDKILSDSLFKEDEIMILKEHIHYINMTFHAITAGAVAFLATGVFLSVLYYPHFWVTLALAVGVKRTLRNELCRFDVFDKYPDYSWERL